MATKAKKNIKSSKTKSNRPGQPKMFNTPEELQEAIDNYFDWAEETGRYITISDLAYYIGTNRTTLMNYENCLENGRMNDLDIEIKKEFVNTIKRAKARVEGECEQAAFYKHSATGAIFSLKNNFGWKDKQEIEQTGETTVNNKIDLSGMSTEDIKKLLDEN